MQRLLVILLFLIPNFLNCQQSVVKGIVSIHNSKFETGVRKYVTFAEITDELNRSFATTNSNGEFNLVYVGIPDQQTVSFNVKKKGLEVVNISALKAVTGQHEPVRISMASPERVDEFRKKIYQIGKTEADRKLEVLVRTLKYQASKLKSDKTRNLQKIIYLEQQVSDLEANGKNLNETRAQELAKRYALLNLDDLNSTFQKAFIAFQKGELDIAIKSINAVNYESLIKQINEDRKITNQKVVNATAALRLKLDIFQLRFLYDSVFQTYDLLILLNPDSISIRLEYAHFLNAFGFYFKALEKYQDCLAYLMLLNDEEKGRLFENLGVLYSKTGSYLLAEQYLKRELAILDTLKIQGNVQQNSIARAKVNLGYLYGLFPNKLDDARLLLKEAVMSLNCTDASSRETKFYTAKTLGNLAIIYGKLFQFDSAKSVFLHAIELVESIGKISVEEGQTYVGLLNDFAVSNYTNGNFSFADSLLKKESDLLTPLYKKYPAVFANEMIYYLANRGMLCEYQNMKNCAKDYYLRVLRLLHEFGDSNRVNVVLIGGTYFSLGQIYFDQKNNDSSKLYLLKGINYLKRYNVLADFLLKEYVGALISLADMSFQEQQFHQCLRYLIEAKEKNEQLKTTRLKDSGYDSLIRQNIDLVNQRIKDLNGIQ